MHISAMKKFFLFSSSLLLFYTAHNERTTRLCRDEIRQNDDKKAKTLTKHTFCKEGISPVRVFRKGHLANWPFALNERRRGGEGGRTAAAAQNGNLFYGFLGWRESLPSFTSPTKKDKDESFIYGGGGGTIVLPFVSKSGALPHNSNIADHAHIVFPSF